MKLKKSNILHIVASLLLSCGLLRAAEALDPVRDDGHQVVSARVDSDGPIACSMPCGDGLW